MNDIQEIAKMFIESEFNKNIQDIISMDMSHKDKKKMIKYVIETKAWNDATIRERYKGESDVLINKDRIVDYVTDKINRLSNEYIDFREWHKKVMDDLAGLNMSCGLAQKLINMSIKYIYFLGVGYDCIVLENNKSITIYQEKFDVPIDSYILKWILYNSLFDKKIKDSLEKLSVWTELKNREIYHLLQERAKYLLREAFPQYPILIAESKVWRQIKSIKTIV